MSFTFYVAANARDDIEWAADMIERLEAIGGTCTFNWTGYGPDEAQELGECMIASAKQAEVFVLKWRDYLQGALWEAGAAAAGGARIYVVGRTHPERSPFLNMPQVELVKDHFGLIDRIVREHVLRPVNFDLDANVCLEAKPT